jgi:hypothetical protein
MDPLGRQIIISEINFDIDEERYDCFVVCNWTKLLRIVKQTGIAGTEEE